jgi:hypothetical protein
MKEPPPYTLVYSTDLKQGKIDYEKETMEMGFTIYLRKSSPSWFEIPETVVNQVRTGIMATGRTQDWGLNWPTKSVAGTTPFISKEDKFTVAVELLNDQRKVIGRQNVTLSYGWKTGVLDGALAITPVADSMMEVTFTAVKADDITDKLNINIAGINGENVQVASRNRRISIVPVDEYLKNNYSIGDTGPAGGIVFYIQGSILSGWQYLEAAPEASEKVLNWNGAISYCKNLNTGGYRDWRLPDKDELNLMYQNLKTKGLGGFGNDYYWSSSESNANYAWYQYFSDGFQSKNYKNDTNSVRAVRAF